MDGIMRAIARRLVLLPAAAGVVLVPWTVGLAIRLPHTAVARHWNVAWAGLDVALLTGLLLTSWLAVRRTAPAALPVIATATATLGCADAWFDICTSGSGAPVRYALAEALPELIVVLTCLVVGLRGQPRDRAPSRGR
jgi:hypothetical protein